MTDAVAVEIVLVLVLEAGGEDTDCADGIEVDARYLSIGPVLYIISLVPYCSTPQVHSARDVVVGRRISYTSVNLRRSFLFPHQNHDILDT